MAEKDSQGPSLELPSLFRRKRGQESTDSAEAPEPTEPPAAATEGTRPAASADDQETAPAPVARREPDPQPDPQADPDAAAEPSPSAPAQASPPDKARRLRPRLTLPSVGATRDVRREPVASAAAEQTSREPEPQPEPQRAPEPVPSRQETGTREQEPVTPAAAATPASAPAPARSATPAAGTATQDRPADRGETPTEERRPRSRPTLPDLAAATAALVVGAVVGLLGVVLTFLGLQGCQLVAGTSSCGGPGLLVLLAIFVAMVLAGAAALRLFGVPEAGSVSFLGTGLLMVILLMFFLEALDHASMLIVIPALAAPCFALARWVTTQLSEDVMEDR